MTVILTGEQYAELRERLARLETKLDHALEHQGDLEKLQRDVSGLKNDRAKVLGGAAVLSAVFPYLLKALGINGAT